MLHRQPNTVNPLNLKLTVRVQAPGPAGIDLEQRQHDAAGGVAPTGVVEGQPIVDGHDAGPLRIALQQGLDGIVRRPAQTGHVERQPAPVRFALGDGVGMRVEEGGDEVGRRIEAARPVEGEALRPLGVYAVSAADVDGIPLARLGGVRSASLDSSSKVPIGDELEETHFVKGSSFSTVLFVVAVVVICDVFVCAVVVAIVIVVVIIVINVAVVSSNVFIIIWRGRLRCIVAGRIV